MRIIRNHGGAATSLTQGAGAVQCIVVHGVPSLIIIEQEQELNCDLIVMGKHGHNPFEEFFIGSVTKRVLAHSQSDVLVSS